MTVLVLYRKFCLAGNALQQCPECRSSARLVYVRTSWVVILVVGAFLFPFTAVVSSTTTLHVDPEL
jgi:hypothetical protein